MKENKEALIRVSEALLERENMDGKELRTLVYGEEAAEEEPVDGKTVAPADGPCIEGQKTTVDE